ncbi:unnamed protein product, partial [Adineta ricciae]
MYILFRSLIIREYIRHLSGMFNPQWNEKKNYRRRLFLMELGYDLVQSHLDGRRQQPHALQQNVRIAIQALGLTGTTSHPVIVSASTGKQHCHLCPRERDRK